MLLAGAALGTFDSVLILTHGGPGTETLTPGPVQLPEGFPEQQLARGGDLGLVHRRGGDPRRRGLSALSRGRWHGEPASRRLDAAHPPSGPRSSRHPRGRGIIASVLPLAWTILASVGIRPDNTSTPPSWRLSPTLEAYTEIGTAEKGFWGELAASLTTSAASTLVTIVIAFLAAYSIVHSRMRGKERLMQAFLVLASLPVMAYAIPLDGTVRALHLHDTFAGVILAQAAIFAPLAVYVLFGYLSEAAIDFEEAARLDGASPWRTLAQVVLPMNAPGVAATAIVIFVLSWNSFLAPLVVTTHHHADDSPGHERLFHGGP